MANNPAAPLSMVMFDLIISLCNAFPSLNPFSIRNADATEVIWLINKMIRKGRMVETPNQSGKQRVLKYADEVSWC